MRTLDSLQIPFEKGTTNLSSLLSRLLAIQRREDHFARVIDQIQRDDDPPAPRVQGGKVERGFFRESEEEKGEKTKERAYRPLKKARYTQVYRGCEVLSDGEPEIHSVVAAR